MSVLTAASTGVLTCHACGMLHRTSTIGLGIACRRCGTALHARKRDSITRTWALLIAAYVLFVPANVLPVMVTASLSGAQSDTILSGVVFLWVTGSWPLALIIFVASIVVPGAKLLALTFLLVTVQRGSAWAQLQRARLYRVIELVGRWSMVDIYVATVLAALVQFGGLMSIRPGPGAIAFGAVVVLTMLAVECFDPRLIWDRDVRHG